MQKFFLIAIIFYCLQLYSLDPGKAINQYTIKNYTSKNGLPQNSVRTILQTGDDYMWFGTEEGLVKFDGYKFTLYERMFFKTIKSTNINDIVSGGGEFLWFSTFSGEVVKFNYRKKSYQIIAKSVSYKGDYIKIFYLQGGKVWGKTNTGFLYVFENDILKDTQIGKINTLTFGNKKFYIAKENELFQLEENGKLLSVAKTASQINYLLVDHKQKMWIGTDEHGLYILDTKDKELKRYRKKELLNEPIKMMFQDRDRNVWVAGKQKGLFRFTDANFPNYSIKDRYPLIFVSDIKEDSEGNIWIGTLNKGVTHFIDNKIAVFSKKQGLINRDVFSLYEKSDGEILIGAIGAAYRLKDGVISEFKLGNYLRSNTVIASLLHSSDGTYFISADNIGEIVLKGDNLKLIETVDGIMFKNASILFEDSMPSIVCLSICCDVKGTRRANLVKLVLSS